jgi:PAT family beta-lactamase induction signal transducer AmpG
MNRKMIAVFVASVCSGMPIVLISGTLQAWLTTLKIDLTTLGIFAFISLPYSIKFAWAPILDRPLFLALEKRKSWMFLTQAAVILSITAMAYSNPSISPIIFTCFALLVAFWGANLDSAVDAYKTSVFDKKEIATGATVSYLAYRLGVIFASSSSLTLADQYSWKTSYLFIAAILAVGALNSWFAPKPKQISCPPNWEAKTSKVSFRDAIKEVLTRKGVVGIILFILTYKMNEAFVSAMSTPFILHLGFSQTELATAIGTVSLAGIIASALFGGFLLNKWGTQKSLWIFSLLQALSELSFLYLIHVGHSFLTLSTILGFETFFSSMGYMAFTSFLMSFCHPRYTATQYATVMSLLAITRISLGMASGFLATLLGWNTYFLLSFLFVIPSLLLITQYNRWDIHPPSQA